MDFDKTENEQALVKKVTDLIARLDLPEVSAIDEAEPGEFETALRPWLKALGETGYLAHPVDTALLAAQYELAIQAPWLVFATDIGARLVSQMISDSGPKELLEPIQKGEWIVSLAISEESSALAARAEPVEGGFRIQGQKAQAALAPIADVIAVTAKLGDGFNLFVIDRETDGLTVGERIPTLGYQALGIAPISLSGVLVPKERMVGPLAVDPHFTLQENEDRALTAMGLGIIRRCLEHAKERADRPRFGGRTAAANQLVRFQLAEMLTLLQTAEILTFRAFSAFSLGARDAASLLLCAKVFATEAACQVSDQALQIMGGSGYAKGNPVERAFRQARLGTILGHGSRAARMAIADSILERH